MKKLPKFSDDKRRLLELFLEERGVVTRGQEPIPRRDPDDPAPLSFNQEGLWFVERLDPGRTVYNIPAAVRLEGRLDSEALERSLNEIVRRQGSLRTVFPVRDGSGPVQEAVPYRPFKLEVEDLSRLPERERNERTLQIATRAARSSVDLTRGPVFRALLLRLGVEEHVLLLTIHHIVCDGWSIGVFTRELATLYEAFSHGGPSPLPELPVQFSDFAAWERRRMRGALLDDHLGYWREVLGGDPPSLELPTDRSRPPDPSFQGMHESLRVSRELSDDLRALSLREGVTLFHTLIAAFKVLLHCRSGQDDIVIGSTFANRNRVELENLIGYFVNVLPLRTDLSGNPTFRELQRRVYEASLGVAAHQELSLSKLVKELRPERYLSRNPFFQVVFYLLTRDHNPAVYGFGISPVSDTIELSGVTLTPVHFECGLSRFDIAVLLWEFPDGLAGTVEYSTELFDPSTIRELVADYRALLRHVAALRDVRLDQLVDLVERGREREFVAKKNEFEASIYRSLKSIKPRQARRKVESD